MQLPVWKSQVSNQNCIQSPDFSNIERKKKSILKNKPTTGQGQQDLDRKLEQIACFDWRTIGAKGFVTTRADGLFFVSLFQKNWFSILIFNGLFPARPISRCELRALLLVDACWFRHNKCRSLRCYPALQWTNIMELSRKLWVSSRTHRIFVVKFLRRADFDFADFCIECTSRQSKVLSSFFSSKSKMREFSGCLFQTLKGASRIEIRQGLPQCKRRMRWIRRCCEQIYKNCVIVFYVTKLLSNVYASDFMCANASNSGERTKSFPLEKALAWCRLWFAFWIVSRRLLRIK